MERSFKDGQSLIYINPLDLHDTWPLIKTGLESVLEKIEADWIPEDVYCALRTGKSTLHLAYNEDEYEGFVVLTPTQNHDGLVLFIWCAYSPVRNVVDTYYPEIEQMARNIGARKVQFASPRKGWAKMFTSVTTIYERKV